MTTYQIFDHTVYIRYICVQGNQHHTKNGLNTQFDSTCISENYTDMQEKTKAKLRDIARPRPEQNATPDLHGST